MTENEKFNNVLVRYKSLINRYIKQSKDARIRYYFYQGIVITLTAMTPVLVVAFPDIKSLHALLPALASIAMGWSTLKQFKDQWRRRILAACALQKEYSFFIGKCGDYKNVQDKNLICHFVERIAQIVETEQVEWEKLVHIGESRDQQQGN